MTSKIFQPETDMKKIPGRYSSTSIFGITILGITLVDSHAPILRERAVRMLRGRKIMTVPGGGNKPKEYPSNNIVHLENRTSYKHAYRVHDQIKGTMTVDFSVLARGGQVYRREHICRSLFGIDNLYLGWRVSSPGYRAMQLIWQQRYHRAEYPLPANEA